MKKSIIYLPNDNYYTSISKYLECILFENNFSIVHRIKNLFDEIVESISGEDTIKVFIINDHENSRYFEECFTKTKHLVMDVDFINIYIWRDSPVLIEEEEFSSCIKKIESVDWTNIKKCNVGACFYSPLLVIDKVKKGPSLKTEHIVLILYNIIISILDHLGLHDIPRDEYVRIILTYSFRIDPQHLKHIKLAKILMQKKDEEVELPKIDLKFYENTKCNVKISDKPKLPEIQDHYLKNIVDKDRDPKSWSNSLYDANNYNAFINQLRLIYEKDKNAEINLSALYITKVINFLKIHGNVESISSLLEYLYDQINNFKSNNEFEFVERQYFTKDIIKTNIRNDLPSIQDFLKKIDKLDKLKSILKLTAYSAIPVFIIALYLFSKFFFLSRSFLFALIIALVLGTIFQFVLRRYLTNGWYKKIDSLCDLMNSKIKEKLYNWIEWRRTLFTQFNTRKNHNIIKIEIDKIIYVIKTIRDSIIELISKGNLLYNISDLNININDMHVIETCFQLEIQNLKQFKTDNLFDRLYRNIEESDSMIDTKKKLIRNLKEIIVHYNEEINNTDIDWKRVRKKISEKLFAGDKAAILQLQPPLLSNDIRFGEDKKYFICSEPFIDGINENEARVSSNKLRGFYISFLKISGIPSKI